MTKRVARISLPAKTVLGHRKNGLPIYNIAGGSEPAVEPAVITIPVPAEAVIPLPQSFTAEDIAKARKEEKDKLYGKMQQIESGWEAAKNDIAALTASKAAEVSAAAEAARVAAEEAAKQKWEEQDSKSLLADAQKEWQSKFDAIQAERDNDRVLFAKEQEFSALQQYAQNKVTEALQGNLIAPELADFVAGNTAAEIDASLELVKAKSNAIVENIASAQVQAKAQMRGVSPTGYSTSGPMDTDPAHKSYSNEQLKNMSMAEYAKNRASLLGAASAPGNRGLFN